MDIAWESRKKARLGIEIHKEEKKYNYLLFSDREYILWQVGESGWGSRWWKDMEGQFQLQCEVWLNKSGQGRFVEQLPGPQWHRVFNDYVTVFFAFDLSSMTQTNLSTGAVRQVRRLALACPL